MSKDRKNTPFSWEVVAADLERKVVNGAHDECRDILNTLTANKIPREWACRFGDLAYRVYVPLFVLKALHRFVHPENSFSGPATDREKVLYASALFSLGAVRESVETLKPIDPKKEPEALYYLAIAHFFDWNYGASLSLLREFVSSEAINPYRRLVGKVNLASALITLGEWGGAGELLSEIKAECENNDYRLLLGNTHELLAQLAIFHGRRFEESLRHLERSRDLLSGQGGLYSLFVEKWTAIVHCYLSRREEDLKRLHAVREKAISIGHWETARECDLFEAIVFENESLLRKVIMGTPSDHYRDRARRLSGKSFKPIGKYYWQLSELADSSPSQIFDPYQKMASGRGLYETPALLALYGALTKDFYKPVNIGHLFQNVYPDEVFNPFTSPDRVLKLLKRLDRWFAENGALVRVVFKRSEFTVTSSEKIQLVVQRGKELSAQEARFSELKERIGDRSFSTATVAQALGISKPSAQRLLAQGVADRKLTKVGKGRSVAYRFADRGKSKGKDAA